MIEKINDLPSFDVTVVVEPNFGKLKKKHRRLVEKLVYEALTDAGLVEFHDRVKAESFDPPIIAVVFAYATNEE